jgi:hypothetical protein
MYVLLTDLPFPFASSTVAPQLCSSPTAGEALLASLRAAVIEGMSAASLAAAASGRAERPSGDEVGAILTAALRFTLAAPLTAFRGVAYVSAECSAALRVKGSGGLCCRVDHRGEVTQGVVEVVQEVSVPSFIFDFAILHIDVL